MDPEGENTPLNNMLVSRVFGIYYGRKLELILEFSKLLTCKWLKLGTFSSGTHPSKRFTGHATSRYHGTTDIQDEKDPDSKPSMNSES